MRARLLALLLGVAGALGDEAGPWHRRWTVGSAKDKAREDTRFVANDGSESVRVVKAVRPTSRCLGRVGRARSFVSHIGQDKFIYKTFFEKAKKVCSGVVMEVGANDGIFASNSLWYEKNLNWHSVCVEANPNLFRELVKNRPRCINLHAGASNMVGKMPFIVGGELGGFVKNTPVSKILKRIRGKSIKNKSADAATGEIVNVTTVSLTKIVDQLGLDTIDFMSIDVEGHELSVVESLDWRKTVVRVLTIEANRGDEPKNAKVKKFLLQQGMKFVKKLDYDEIYAHPSFLQG